MAVINTSGTIFEANISKKRPLDTVDLELPDTHEKAGAVLWLPCESQIGCLRIVL